MAQAITFTKSQTTGRYTGNIQPTKDTVLQLTFDGNTAGNVIGIYRSVDGTNFAHVIDIPYSQKTFCKGLSGIVSGETIRITTIKQPSVAQYI